MIETGFEFYRLSSWQDRFRRYVIEVDGEVCGSLSRKSRLVVAVQAGAHTVRARIDWTGSRATVIEAQEGAVTRVRVGPAPGSPSTNVARSDGWLIVVPDSDGG